MLRTCIAVLVLAWSAVASAECSIGIGVSRAYGSSQHEASNGFQITDAFELRGRGVGIQGACIKPYGRWRYGVASDFTNTKVRGRQQEREPNSQVFAETEVDWLASLRAVGGYQASARTMFFLSAGLAATSVTTKVCAPDFDVCGDDSRKLWGVAGGAGVQFRLSPRWSATAEFLAFTFERREFTPTNDFLVRDVNPNAQLLRLALDFHF